MHIADSQWYHDLHKSWKYKFNTRIKSQLKHIMHLFQYSISNGMDILYFLMCNAYKIIITNCIRQREITGHFARIGESTDSTSFNMFLNCVAKLRSVWCVGMFTIWDNKIVDVSPTKYRQYIDGSLNCTVAYYVLSDMVEQFFLLSLIFEPNQDEKAIISLEMKEYVSNFAIFLSQYFETFLLLLLSLFFMNTCMARLA